MASNTAPVAMFISVEITDAVRSDTEIAKKLTEVCPVNIFAVAPDGACDIVESNLDECVLCELCVEAAPPTASRSTSSTAAKRYSGSLSQRALSEQATRLGTACREHFLTRKRTRGSTAGPLTPYISAWLLNSPGNLGRHRRGPQLPRTRPPSH